MNEVSYLCQNHYNLCNFNVFATDNLHDKYLLNSSVYQANKLCQKLPSEIKGCASLHSLKIKSKLGTAIDVNVRFPQDLLPMLVIFSLFSVILNRHKAKLHCCKL